MWLKIGTWLFTHVVLKVAKREADAAGVALFSEANALVVRGLLISRILAWLGRINETKWGKALETDDQAAWFWQIIMKSDSIGKTLGEQSIREARAYLTAAVAEFGKITVQDVPAETSLSLIRQRIVAAGTILDAKNLLPPPDGSL